MAQLRVLPSDEAEVLHRQRNPVTQTFEYYVHYVECARRSPQFAQPLPLETPWLPQSIGDWMSG